MYEDLDKGIIYISHVPKLEDNNIEIKPEKIIEKKDDLFYTAKYKDSDFRKKDNQINENDKNNKKQEKDEYSIESQTVMWITLIAIMYILSNLITKLIVLKELTKLDDLKYNKKVLLQKVIMILSLISLDIFISNNIFTILITVIYILTNSKSILKSLKHS